MSKRCMPMLLIDGVPRPDKDLRWVPVSTMAEYLGVTASTVYLWRLGGTFPAHGLKQFRSHWRFCPARCVPSEVAP